MSEDTELNGKHEEEWEEMSRERQEGLIDHMRKIGKEIAEIEGARTDEEIEIIQAGYAARLVRLMTTPRELLMKQIYEGEPIDYRDEEKAEMELRSKLLVRMEL